MSRCKSCNEKYHPTIVTDNKDRFVRFDDMCKKCIALSYEEETYDEVFDSVRVSDIDGLLSFINKLSTEKDNYNK